MTATAQQRVARYLDRHADTLTRELVTGELAGVEQVVVIPALAEEATLPLTLADLQACSARQRNRTLAIIVVNNRAAPYACERERTQNQRTLQWLTGRIALQERSRSSPTLRLGVVDAASPGRELAEHEGVGSARRLGLDHGLRVLADNGRPEGVLLCLDADTRIRPDYLSVVHRHFELPHSWAGVLEYEHPLPGDPQHRRAMLRYEIYLRYHVLGLQHAGSPYAYTSIGSTIVCRGTAYAAVGGMNRRVAGEDFYFLQQLAKTGGVDRIRGTTVFPSARCSARTLYGTGTTVQRGLQRGGGGDQLVHPQVFEVLRRWLEMAHNALEAGASELLSHAGTIDAGLRRFLEDNRFDQVWAKLQRHAGSADQLAQQLDRWFDGLKTQRLVHFLRDNGWGMMPRHDAIRLLLELRDDEIPDLDWGVLDEECDIQQSLLAQLKACEASGALHLGVRSAARV